MLRLLVTAVAVSVLASLSVSESQAAVSQAAVGRAPSAVTASGTPLQILASTPVVPSLRVGYKSGLFPNLASTVKDSRGCTLRNQMLIKLAARKPRVGGGCRLSGGLWLADFGKTRITTSSKVRLSKLVPDVYVYGQGAENWSAAQRRAYTTFPVPTRVSKSTRSARSRAATINEQYAGPGADSIVAASAAGQSFMQRVNTLLVKSSDPTQADLDALKASNPVMFEGWTIGTLLNAKAWGISLTPSLFANFQVTLRQCQLVARSKVRARPTVIAPIAEIHNPCTASYTVTEVGQAFQINAIPQIASTVAAQDSTVLNEYGTPMGEAVSRSLFGIHAPAHWVSDFDSANPTGADGAIDPATIPDIPVGYTRLWDTETTWADLEPTRGTFVWRKIDKQIQLAQAVNARVMLVLGKTPAWAGASAQSMPTDISDWRTYVRTVCQRYGASISSYEVWNEANLQTFWTGTAAQMADLTKAAFEEIRGCNPNALVVAANTTSRATGSFGTFFPEYLQELKTRGWPADAYSVHSYPSASGGADDRIKGIGQFRAALALSGAPFTTVFDTETNYGLAGLGESKVDIAGDNAMTLLSRTYIDSVRYGFGSPFWFVWTAQPDSKFGIQLTKQAANERQAWIATYDWLIGGRFQRCLETSKEITVCQFSKGSENFSIIWHGDVGTAPVATDPGYLTGLGSRSCTLRGECQALTQDASVTVGSMPMRIDGPPLSQGPDANPDAGKSKFITVDCLSGRGSPLWTFSCTDFGSVPVGSSAILSVLVSNQSAKSHTLNLQPFASGAGGNGAVIHTPAANECGSKPTGGRGTCILHLTWTPANVGPMTPFSLVVCSSNNVLQCYRTAAANGIRGEAVAAQP